MKRISAFRRHVLLLALALVIAGAGQASAQPTDIDRVFNRLYNYDFTGAHAILDEATRARPSDPLVYAVRGAAYLFAEFERQHILELKFFESDDELTDHKKLKPDPAVREQLLETTAEARRLATELLLSNPNDRDALFALCTAVGTETDYMALIEKRYFKAYRLSKESQKYAHRLLALDPPDYDAYLTIGTVEYVVGSMNAFFRLFIRFDKIEGSKAKAQKDLETVIEHGRYYRPFAKVLLASIHVREDRPAEALALLEELDDEFPGNVLVKKEIVRVGAKIRASAANQEPPQTPLER
ncbi:MAG: hypothetical protein K8R59_06305 [Thermoanaerobaculales bacterium]|nr:hypothetical protein [Thermoanaerobaculales bacterium]